MLDAFQNKIDIGSIVLFSPNLRYTEYSYGEIVKLHPSKKTNGKYGAILPDRVEIQVTSSSTGALSKKNPIVYASNVVKQ